MPVRDAGRRSGCACETAPGASADVRRRKPSGVAVANPPQTGCSRPLSTSTEGKASRRPGELRSDLLGEKSGLGSNRDDNPGGSPAKRQEKTSASHFRTEEPEKPG